MTIEVDPLHKISNNNRLYCNVNNKNGEPFANSGPTLEQKKEMKQYVVLGLVIVAALAYAYAKSNFLFTIARAALLL